MKGRQQAQKIDGPMCKRKEANSLGKRSFNFSINVSNNKTRHRKGEIRREDNETRTG